LVFFNNFSKQLKNSGSTQLHVKRMITNEKFKKIMIQGLESRRNWTEIGIKFDSSALLQGWSGG
jgi:hypothetical protein